jgi:glucokinase
MYIGIDMGGTNLVAGVINKEGDILTKVKCSTDVSKGANAIIDAISALIHEAAEKSGVPITDIKSIGLGIPGTIDHKRGVVMNSPNITQINEFPFRDTLAAQWDIPIYMVNDANAAAFGEAHAGSAEGCDDMVMVTLGTGVGGGIVLGGKLHVGFNHIGAEIGHTVVVKDGLSCNCGRKGCWEKYASASGLITMTRERMEEESYSKMWEISPSLDDVDGMTAFKAADQGDSAGQAVVDLYIDYLACGIGNIINIFQPEIVCIGGGISNEGEALLLPLKERVANDSFRHPTRNTEIRIASLGNDAGLIGAALAHV